MNKKSIFLSICLIAILSIKAQITSVEYPSGYLSEEKIAKILQKSRRSGTQEWELQKQNEILHKQLEKQKEAIANGTYIGPNQKTTQPPHVNSSVCFNAGFESNSTSGWTLFSGNISSPTIVYLPCDACANTSGAITNIVNSTSTITGQCTNGVDNYGGFPVVAPAPSGGVYSLLLNDASAGGKIEQVQYTFLVDSSIDLFTYQYAAVLQSGGHPANEQPYFSVKATDLSTNSIIPCTSNEQNAPSSGNLAGWSISSSDPSVYTKSWATINLNLQSAIGHTVTISFTVSDCDQGGHFGYAYIDASCSSTQITKSNSLCVGGSTTLSGPPGFSSYTWSGPVSGTGQNLFTSTPGNYTLTTTSAGGCSAPTLYYTLTQSATTSTTTVNIQVSKDTICSGTTTTLTASGASSYIWSNNATSNSIVVSPMANTTFSVLGTDNSGCGDTAVSKIINVIQTNVSILATHDSICPGGADILTANGASTYTWSSNAGSATTNTVSVSPTVNSTYTVSGIDNSTGCLGTSIKTVIVKNCSTTGINQFANYTDEVTVFPNPATETLYIECTLKNATLYISDILGNKIKQTSVENELTTIDISSLSKGIYFLNVKTANNVITKKFIVQR